MIRISLTSMLRLVVMLGLVGSAAAVGISRLIPPMRTWRAFREPERVAVNRYFFDSNLRESLWLDRKTGAMTALPMPQGTLLEFAVLSPWRDQADKGQVVGRWGSSGDESCESGLGRVSFPDGALLDHVPTQLVPTSPPCWFPGTTSQILFAAGDGRLYRCDFDDGEAPGPMPLTWRCMPPGLGNEEASVFLADPHWPTDPRFSRILLAGVRTLQAGPKRPVFSPTRIWWLRLGDDGRTIDDAGPLTAAEARTPIGDVEERCPVVGRLPGGAITLAYLSKAGSQSWQTRVVPISIDASQAIPLETTGPARVVAEGCHPSPPIFSGRGLWINVARGGELHGAFEHVEIRPAATTDAPRPRPAHAATPEPDPVDRDRA